MKKKWFITVLVLVLIAIVLTVVFISLFKDKSTYSLAETVNSHVSEGYLNKGDKDNQELQAYFNMMSQNLQGTQAKEAYNSATNYKEMFNALTTLGEFLNEEMIFTEYNQVYKKNQKAIVDDLNKASNATRKLGEDIRDALKVLQGSAFWVANTWNKYESEIEVVMSSTMDAFVRLTNVYDACVKSEILNNDYTKLVFSRIRELISQTKESLSEKTEFSSALTQTITHYIDKNVVLGYQYNDSLKTKVEDILEKGEESSYYESFKNSTLALEA